VKSGALVEATNPFNQISDLGTPQGEITPLYPRMHVSPLDPGTIISVGPQPHSFWFDITDKAGKDIEPKAKGVI